MQWLNGYTFTLHALGSPIGVGCSASCSIAHPALCKWPGKAVEAGQTPWDPEPIQEIWKKVLAPCLRLAQLLPLWLFGE